MIDVLLVDDHPLLQLGLERKLSDLGLSVVIGNLTDRASLLAQVEQVRPTAVVLDHGLPSLGDGLDLVGPLTALGARVMMLTGTIDETMWGACIASGAEAVVAKTESIEDITDSILAVVAGQPIRVQARTALLQTLERARSERRAQMEPFESLSKRERVVLSHLIAGRSPAIIATTEFVSIDTVRSQIKSILRKLGATSQLEAVAQANQVGWSNSQEPLV